MFSDIGSFGENVFKIGMTRRLDPMERVKELSGAAVPFDFDVHVMISCDDALSLKRCCMTIWKATVLTESTCVRSFYGLNSAGLSMKWSANTGRLNISLTR